MKKVLSLVLVAVLALGMGMSAFAAWTETDKFEGFADGYSLTDGYQGTTYTANYSTRTIDMGDELAPMDEHKLVINLYHSMFGSEYNYYNTTNSNTGSYRAYNMDALVKSGLLKEAERANIIAYVKANDVVNDSITRGQVYHNAYVDLHKAVKDNQDAIASSTDANRTQKTLDANRIAISSINSNSSYLPIVELDANGVYQFVRTSTTTTGNITSTQIRKSKFTIGTTNKSGSRVVDSVKLINKDGTIEFKLVKEWVNTGDQDFEVIIYPMIDGKRIDDASVTVYGNVENPITEVYEDYDYVDLSKGYVAEAMEFVNNIEVDLGNGVSIFTKFFKGKKYYGTSTRDEDDAASVVYSQYPDVDNVVILNTVGLNSTGDIVKLDTDYSNYYVYDKDMKYLGQSSEMLPYSTRYYLANKQLNVNDAADDDDDDEDWDDDDSDPLDGGSNPGTGGDAGIPNANANPGTGR